MGSITKKFVKSKMYISMSYHTAINVLKLLTREKENLMKLTKESAIGGFSV